MNLCLAAYSLMRQSEGGRQAGREGGRNRAGKSWGKGIEREETAREGGWEQRQEREAVEEEDSGREGQEECSLVN